MKTVTLLEASIPAEQSIRLAEVAKLIFKAKKTVVLTGAGISCNAGIPDFRSSDGLYNLVKAKHPNLCVKGQDLFDISLFRNQLTLLLFCTFMEGLYKLSLSAKPTDTHRFIKHLKEKNKLLRCYTQNIDLLEKTIDLNCGINMSEFDQPKSFSKNWKNLDVVQLHGNLHKLSCTQCFATFDWTPESQLQLSDGENPECSNCHLKYQERLYLGKRLTGTIGMLRPDIVLYGENHPQLEILSKGLNMDLNLKSDLLIIMGTSLKVDGVKKVVRTLAKSIHDKGGKVIFVNKTPLAKNWDSVVDYEVLSDCDNFVRLLKIEIPDLFLTQEQLDSKKLKRTSPKPEKLMTPPSTPKKEKKPAQIPKGKPLLKRIKTTKNSIKVELPSPTPSFSENDVEIIKIESDSETAVKTESRKAPLRLVTKSRLNTTVSKRKFKQEPETDRGAAKRLRV